MDLCFPYHPDWEVPLDPAILSILNQPFFFIGKGSQSYVFASEDGKFVVKFFRFDDRRIKLFHQRQRQPESAREKAEIVFAACKIAYDRLQEETGLVYMHLNLSQGTLPILYCKDALGRPYKFPLDQCRFVLQKKATLFRDALLEARSNPDQMRARLDQFIALLLSRTSKGVFNTDPTLSRNFGFLDHQAIEIDFGNYRPASSRSPENEVKRYTDRLREWLLEEAPEWVGYLDKRIEEI